MVATPVASATANPAALTPHASAAQLADRMVQHRAALQSRRSLTYKIATGAIAASNIPSVTVGPPPLDEPKITETAIEMPYRLIISPNQYGAWAHASTPISSPAERTELWHTRLGRRPSAAEPIDETAAAQYSWNFSAIWARDPAIKEKQAPAHDQVPFRTSLDAFDRWNIVHQSYNHPTADIVANRMMLTTLRASATPLFVSHRGALGRHLAVCAARLEPRVALMSRRTMVVEAEQEPGYWVGGDP